MIEFYDKDNLPAEDDPRWREFRKTTTTKMFYVGGMYDVETREGTLQRVDGWLAVDADGFPYPIDPGIHDQSYVEVADCEHCTCYQPCCDCGEMAP